MHLVIGEDLISENKVDYIFSLVISLDHQNVHCILYIFAICIVYFN